MEETCWYELSLDFLPCATYSMCVQIVSSNSDTYK